MRRFLFIAALLALAGASSAAEEKKAVAELARQIRRAADLGKAEEAHASISELAALKSEESLKELFKLGLEISSPGIYSAIDSALAEQTDARAFQFFEAEAKTQKEVRQIYVAEILSRMKSPRAVEILALFADEKSTLVVRAAIPALAEARSAGSVPPLLKILERLEAAKDRGQIYQEARDALFALTGQDHESAADWRKWWEGARPAFQPAAHDPIAVRRPSREAAPEIAGKKIFGKSVVFVIGTSESMRTVMKHDDPAAVGGFPGQVDVEEAPKDGGRQGKYWSRMEMAKRLLIKALSAFDPRARLNVIEYNTAPKRYTKALAPAAQKQRLIEWVKRLRWAANGQNDIQAALQEAFDVERSITEIYLLTDRPPSAGAGGEESRSPLFELVESRNRFRKVKIHTFGFDASTIGQEDDAAGVAKANAFLERLARMTGGSFTAIKSSDDDPPKPLRLPAGDR